MFETPYSFFWNKRCICYIFSICCTYWKYWCVKIIKLEIVLFLQLYAISLRSANDKNVVLEDKKCIECIIRQSSIGGIKRALITRDLYYGWTKLHIEYEKDEGVFNTKEWELLTALDDDFLYSDLDYDEYAKEQLLNLQKIANTISAEDITILVNSAIEIINESRFENGWIL